MRPSPPMLLATHLNLRRAAIAARHRARERLVAMGAFSMTLAAIALVVWIRPAPAVHRFVQPPRVGVEILPLDSGPSFRTGAGTGTGIIRSSRSREGGATLATALRLPSQGPTLVRPSADATQAARRLTRAQEAFLDGALDAALREARRAARLGAGADALVVAGNVHFTRREYPRALATFTQAQRLAPDDPRIARKLQATRAMLGPGGNE